MILVCDWVHSTVDAMLGGNLKCLLHSLQANVHSQPKFSGIAVVWHMVDSAAWTSKEMSVIWLQTWVQAQPQ